MSSVFWHKNKFIQPIFKLQILLPVCNLMCLIQFNSIQFNSIYFAFQKSITWYNPHEYRNSQRIHLYIQSYTNKCWIQCKSVVFPIYTKEYIIKNNKVHKCKVHCSIFTRDVNVKNVSLFTMWGVKILFKHNCSKWKYLNVILIIRTIEMHSYVKL